MLRPVFSYRNAKREVEGLVGIKVTKCSFPDLLNSPGVNSLFDALMLRQHETIVDSLRGEVGAVG